ncbi:MAG: metallophosphoesterase [Acidobacteriota bacterium]
MQSILWLAHGLIYLTLTMFEPLNQAAANVLAIVLFVLSISFTIAAGLSYRYSNWLVSALYKVSVIWLGMLNFLTWAAALSWVADLAFRVAGQDSPVVREYVGIGIFAAAIAVSLYGFVNARVIRERRVTVELKNLPEAWRDRTALLISDVHLGNVNGPGFARRVARIARRLNPSVVFLAGDVYDGARVDPEWLAHPLEAVQPPLGVYFCGGNHEDYGDALAYEAALRGAGVEVLHDARVELDGLQIVGVSYATASHPLRFRAFLERLRLHEGGPAILLNHVPHGLNMAEQARVDLQLSGHTHGGQIFPFTFFTRRIFRQFTHGLARLGNLQVITSSGIGTWGPPMRVGTAPEVVLITFA